jgi:hypothetical protein
MIHLPLVSYPSGGWEKTRIGFCRAAGTFETCYNEAYFLVVKCERESLHHTQHSQNYTNKLEVYATKRDKYKCVTQQTRVNWWSRHVDTSFLSWVVRDETKEKNKGRDYFYMHVEIKHVSGLSHSNSSTWSKRDSLFTWIARGVQTFVLPFFSFTCSLCFVDFIV